MKGAPRFCEHPIIRAVISDMWFSKGLESYGVKHADLFSPIPLPTLALLMSMVSSLHFRHLGLSSHVRNKIEFCLNEWITGVFVSDKLQESSLKKKFSGHLKSVFSWDGLNPEVTRKIRQKIFDDLRWVVCLCTRFCLLYHFTACPQVQSTQAPLVPRTLAKK